jgi:hypothetical protein
VNPPPGIVACAALITAETNTATLTITTTKQAT